VNEWFGGVFSAYCKKARQFAVPGMVHSCKRKVEVAGLKFVNFLGVGKYWLTWGLWNVGILSEG